MLTYYDSALNRECQDMTTSLININQICFKIGQKVNASMPPAMLNLVKFFGILWQTKIAILGGFAPSIMFFSKRISGLHTAFWPRDALLSVRLRGINAHSVSPPAR